MSRRLQVVVADADFERYRSTAQAAGVNVSEWVRQALRAAQREASDGDIEAKLAAIRTAAGHSTSGSEVDTHTMLSEIEAGRLSAIAAGMPGADDA